MKQYKSSSETFRIVFTVMFFITGGNAIMSQSLIVADKSKDAIPIDQSEKQFSEYVAKKVQALNVSQKGAENFYSEPVIVNKDLSISFPMINGFDTNKTFSVQLNIGLTNGGKECFSYAFILDKNTATEKGSAFYINSGKMNFDITTRALKGEPLFCTLTIIGDDNSIQTYNSQYNVE